MYKEEKALVISERQQHEAALKELNNYVRERETEHIETLNNLSVIMTSIDNKLNLL
jgi:hypothetical protein